MTISTTDIYFLESERLSDTADGGGFPTGNVVVDGAISSVFPAVSSLDRTVGDVGLRLVYPGAYSATDDTFYGAGVVILQPPADPNTTVMIFEGRLGEERTDVQQRIESYLSPGVQTPWRLYQNHLQGVGALTLFGFSDSPDFLTGETLILTDTSNGDTETVRIERIQSRTAQTFSDVNGTFQRDLLVLILSRGLTQDMPGEFVTRTTASTPSTRVQRTTVSDGARYYGIKPITSAITAGDLTVQIDSPLAPLVPSTTTETAIVNSTAGASTVVYSQTGATNALSVSVTKSYTSGTAMTAYYGGPVLPGSVNITGTFSGSDDSTGQLVLNQANTSGTINYATGEIAITANSSGTASLTMTATPAAAINQGNLTKRFEVTVQTRSQTYVTRLSPPPSPRSTSFSYRSFGAWYELVDQGNGTVTSTTPGEGSGTINYATGDLVITMGQLPDVGSELLTSWGAGINVRDARSSINADDPEIRIAGQQPQAEPNSVTITYPSGGGTITLTDDGDGNIITAALSVVGRISYPDTEISFRPSDWPDPGAQITLEYDAGTRQEETFQPTVGGGGSGPVTITLAVPPRPGSLRVRWLVEYSANGQFQTAEIAAIDDGANGLIYQTAGALNGTAVVGASVNYTTGEVSFPTTATVTTQQQITEGTVDIDHNGVSTVNIVVVGFQTIQANWTFATGGSVYAVYKDNTATDVTQNESVSTPPIEIDLAPATADKIAPGSVRFTLNGRTYVDRSGALVYALDSATNAGTNGGSINYSTGIATITNWAAGTANVSLVSLGVISGDMPVSAVFGRTDTAPIKQGSYSISAVELDTGINLTATTDVNGTVSGTRVAGFIDVETGVYQVRFGQFVTAAGNESEWWYDADAVESGMIWKPALIVPGTATFNAVAFTSLPLDPVLLGLDPIRLPQNGLVPIFRPANVAMVVRSKTVQDASPSAGATVDLLVPTPKYVTVKDANGNDVASDKYSIDQGLAELQWANPLDLSAYTAPFSIFSVFYYQSLVTDVQINGAVTLSTAAPVSLPADGETYLTSKRVAGDIRARYFNLFTQESWTGVWSDNLIGNSPTIQYDDINYPLTMTNQGAQDERWRIQLTSATTANVIGEKFGQVLTNVSLSSTIAPINPATGVPYFSINPAGWSGGGATGNILRFNTSTANFPTWFIRTVLPGPDFGADKFVALVQGDVEAA